MAKKFDNIIKTIGNTPVVKINKLAPKNVNLYVKIESFNPMSSVKDRLAMGVIEDAERSGKLKPGQTVVEATSGNTGIGLAMVCAQKGYPLVLVMSEAFSVERRKMMRFLGAKVVLTPAHHKVMGMLNKAVELAEKHGWFLCHQFENEANADIHSKTTAPEILEAFKGETLDYWVTGFGTGGTLKGVGRVLRKESPKTKIIVCEPDNSQLLTTNIAQKRNTDGSPAESHKGYHPHLMQGWTPDFIPKLTGDAVEAELIDKILAISGEDAIKNTKALAQKEGIFCGITSGATFTGALKIAQEAPKGSNILCMLPDTGERYLSTPLFMDIPEEMTRDEWDISRSTPGSRFDAPHKPTAKKEPEKPVPADKESREFVEKVLKENKVVIFAFEWCEFCWAAKNMFKKCELPFKAIDIDSAKYQENDMGNRIRAAINEKTGCKTIPQIFVGGVFIGGCTETFDAYREKRFQKELEKNTIKYKELGVDPYELLPAWLQPR